MEIFGKTVVFPRGYGQIGEIPHRRIWPVGVYRVKGHLPVYLQNVQYCLTLWSDQQHGQLFMIRGDPRVGKD